MTRDENSLLDTFLASILELCPILVEIDGKVGCLEEKKTDPRKGSFEVVLTLDGKPVCKVGLEERFKTPKDLGYDSFIVI